MGTKVSIPGVKVRTGRDADHSTTVVLRLRISRTYNLLPLGACMAVAGQLSMFTICCVNENRKGEVQCQAFALGMLDI
jgi:hypothetical protein